MTPEEFVAEAKRRGIPKEQVKEKYDALKASGAFSGSAEKPISGMQRFAYGALKPVDALAQMAYNAVPQSLRQAGDQANNWLADRGVPLARIPEGGFNQQLADTHQEYIRRKPETDVAGVLGNIGTGIALTRGIPVGQTFPSIAGSSAATGAALGPLEPVYDPKADFWKTKAKQLGLGAGLGLAASPVGYGLSRVVAPKAATNPDVQALRGSGVTPSVGQTLGGMTNRMEQKAQSIPILGDAITSARASGRDQFNNVLINDIVKRVSPEKIEGSGRPAINKAQKIVSNAYEDALKSIKGVTLDSAAQSKISGLNRLSTGLSNDMQRHYQKFMQDRINPMISPAGGMQAHTFKNVISELQKKADSFGKGTAMEQELGNLYRELKAVLMEQALRSNPTAGTALKNADAAYASLVRLEGASNKSAVSGGQFTPGQYLGAIRQADQSVRKRRFAGGNALGQQYGESAQRVLGDVYPDSGTAGRMLLDMGALASGFIEPSIPLALTAAGGMYLSPMQKFLNAAVASRPGAAQPAAQFIRQSTPAAVLPLAGILDAQ